MWEADGDAYTMYVSLTLASTRQRNEPAVPFVANKSLCAVRAVRSWLDACAFTEGPLIRAFSLQGAMIDRSIARTVQSKYILTARTAERPPADRRIVTP
jgi:hypothetical protein